ncbi:MAG: LacI family transcriptional regulator [Armatimonadota bacterium]|nr:LacI family transcriptional regulator [Armatimonadota bacterium]
MPVTSKDIARELQLSQSTVSRILSGAPGHRASNGTRRRVEEAARRLGYQPNAIAQSLRQGRTRIIGLYTNHDYDARNEFLGTIIGALQRACEHLDLDLLLHSALMGRSPEETFGRLRDGRIDGLILHANQNDPLVALLGSSPLPVVAIADLLPDLHSVICDDADGMRQLMMFLWERGYRRFVFLSPDYELTSVERRHAAFHSEMARHQVDAKDQAVFPIPNEQAEHALDRILAFGKGCAVICWNDRTAYNLLRACQTRDLRVPDDLGIAGFDGFPNDKNPAHQLVSVRCPWDRLAAVALEALNACVEGIPDVPREICLPVSLLPGDTV